MCQVDDHMLSDEAPGRMLVPWCVRPVLAEQGLPSQRRPGSGGSMRGGWLPPSKVRRWLSASLAWPRPRSVLTPPAGPSSCDQSQTLVLLWFWFCCDHSRPRLISAPRLHVRTSVAFSLAHLRCTLSNQQMQCDLGDLDGTSVCAPPSRLRLTESQSGFSTATFMMVRWKFKNGRLQAWWVLGAQAAQACFFGWLP